MSIYNITNTALLGEGVGLRQILLCSSGTNEFTWPAFAPKMRLRESKKSRIAPIASTSPNGVPRRYQLSGKRSGTAVNEPFERSCAPNNDEMDSSLGTPPSPNVPFEKNSVMNACVDPDVSCAWA